MERVKSERTVVMTLNGVEYAVSPRLAAMLTRLVEGRATQHGSRWRANECSSL
jgi:hypothetical protein